MLRTFALAALLIVTALPVKAGYSGGIVAYERGDYRTAFREMKPLAEQGNAAAQSYLGFLYDNGQGVPRNYREAFKWYRKAAEQGNVPAQNNLGVMYANGRDFPRNYVLAYLWYSLAAARGNKTAAKNLGDIEKRMTPAQVAKALAMVAKWKPEKAKPAK